MELPPSPRRLPPTLDMVPPEERRVRDVEEWADKVIERANPVDLRTLRASTNPEIQALLRVLGLA